MLDIEQSLASKFPSFARQRPLVRSSTLSVLRKLVREGEINAFLGEHRGQVGKDFIDRVFEHFDFGYSVSQRERDNIPAQGRVLIVANHPIGSLDGLALLRLVCEVRADVRIVANDLLMSIAPLRELMLPLDNLGGGMHRQSYRAIVQALDDDQAVIIFPAGEVSRAGPKGIRDGRWQGGFLHFARRTGAPLLPVFVDARNSLLFYGASMIFKPLATLLLAQEMFNKRSAEIRLRVGEVIPNRALAPGALADKELIRRLKKHLYKVGKRHKAVFVTEKAIAPAEDRAALGRELDAAQLLGRTADRHRIHLCDYERQPAVLREVGRLREQAFRRVGEGTGRRRDLDRYDRYYRHLVLWDEQKLCVAGAYRLGEAMRIAQSRGAQALYTAELFEFAPAFDVCIAQGLELGRSFVHPDYWGKASLDYLWQGLGAYLRHHPEIRYVFGPVSMSAAYPKALRDLLVGYYERYYRRHAPGSPEAMATGRRPYRLDAAAAAAVQMRFEGLDAAQGLASLQQAFREADCKIPVLFKQYAGLYEEGGYEAIDFSVDVEFGDCVDGLFLGDLHFMKAAKRARYLAEPEPLAACALA
jgi:putative hemolysin